MPRGASNAKKYGQPIYACAWLDDRTALLAGGGGKKSSGIPNRILIASLESSDTSTTTLAEAEAWTHTDEDAPQRLAVRPGGEEVVCAFGGTLGVFRARRSASGAETASGDAIGEEKGKDRSSSTWTIAPANDLGLPSRVSVTPDEREIKCAAFNAEGTRLAIGLESGEVKILLWPSLEVEKELGAHEKGAVTDIAWAPDGDDLLTTSAENATTSNIGRGAVVWSVERGERVRTLFDESIANSRARNVVFRGAAYGPGTSASTSVAWTGVNLDGEGWVVKWDAKTWKVISKARVFKSEPISGFSVNAQGTLVAVGSSEGEVKVIDAQKFTLIKPVKRAHMIFVTAMAWNPKGNVVLSGSADASALATKIKKQSWTLRLLLWFTVLVVLILCWVTVLSAIFPDPIARVLESRPDSWNAVADFFSEGIKPTSAAESIAPDPSSLSGLRDEL
ncbi:Quinonprotein alcohol dehydrogenase-like superfamily [Ostreococcus tauri]|uniref:Quinonprotein alcohol dehydrogenase-like superfamily n=1 Tax=Ostreococcus tauri TaxID=70448 RepID=A0A090M2C8_OSTTA|nr:Quinonprotein alcohol dehydrogenase-like superfamily [Ostreococcus tauri]CEF98356.1 Quinonprotein alcohol dehydrogenase-like superfamily [Ostreococcus tauri]|eukprot:XP_022839224.1 Quinonprotein alcohol dehydrogenase-like superfamily [Ostreococcus tauri]